jgi:hypothetical protein
MLKRRRRATVEKILDMAAASITKSVRCRGGQPTNLHKPLKKGNLRRLQKKETAFFACCH